MIQIREFVAPTDGPKLLIFGAIHGNEVCGTRALHKLAKELDSGERKLLKGRLTMVPICNELAYAAEKRFIDENLNRVFTHHEKASSHERRVAAKLLPLMASSDFFLDIHSMQAEGEAFSFLNRATRESENFCKSLGMRWIVTGWPELYAKHPDRLSACTQSFADSLSKPNVLVECGTNGSPEADKKAYEVCLRSMAYLGMTSSEHPAPRIEATFLKLTDLFFRDSLDDQLSRVFKNFEAVSEGELIGCRDKGGAPVLSPRTGFIVFPNPTSAVGTEWFYIATDA